MSLFVDERFIRGFNPATKSVPLLYFLYLCTVPLAKLLIYCRIKPNAITTLSNLVAIAGLVFLVQGYSMWLFPMAWMLALFLDIADGIVARVSGQSSAQGSFYDHMSDQVKVIALFLCIGLRYDEYSVWAIAFVVNGMFMFYGVINHFHSIRALILNKASRPPVLQNESDCQQLPKTPPQTSRGRVKAFLNKYPLAKRVLLGVYVSLFVMYGNCMVLLLLVGLGREWAMASMLLFGVVTFRSLTEVMQKTIELNRRIAQAKISWSGIS